MTDPQRQSDLRRRLETFGDPRKTWRWQKGEPDYVAALGLTPEDAPQLLAVAREWIEPQDSSADDQDMSVYAPVHAWRSLAHLKTAEAIPVLLDMLGPMDERGDDWHLEEFPHAFAWIGAASIEPLAAYANQSIHAEFARICAAHAMQEVAARHGEQRDRVVAALGAQLEQFAEQPPSFNGFLISYLLRLKARETADVIERAFAADHVDLAVVGNWNRARQELGVEGQGLVPEALAGQRAWPIFPPLKFDEPSGSHVMPRNRDQRRAERKRERRNRKRGRRR